MFRNEPALTTSDSLQAKPVKISKFFSFYITAVGISLCVFTSGGSATHDNLFSSFLLSLLSLSSLQVISLVLDSPLVLPHPTPNSMNR